MPAAGPPSVAVSLSAEGSSDSRTGAAAGCTSCATAAIPKSSTSLRRNRGGRRRDAHPLPMSIASSAILQARAERRQTCRATPTSRPHLYPCALIACCQGPRPFQSPAPLCLDALRMKRLMAHFACHRGASDLDSRCGRLALIVDRRLILDDTIKQAARPPQRQRRRLPILSAFQFYDRDGLQRRHRRQPDLEAVQ